MKPIEVVYSFNDNYAELAAVSMTSLVYNTKRDCHIHIFENSLSRDILNKVIKIEDMYPNGKITVHHIPDEKFAEIADHRFGKETWYPMLAPEILYDLDKVLVLEPDTLICRDISELHDIELVDRYAAVMSYYLTIDEFDNHKPCIGWSRFNGGVILYNLKIIREKNLFDTYKITEAVKIMKPHYNEWIANESYQSLIFNSGNVILLEQKYNSYMLIERYLSPRLHRYFYFNFDEMYEAFNNPVVIHYVGKKPNVIPNNFMIDFRFAKWYDYLSLSPFSSSENDAERLEKLQKHITRFRDKPLKIDDYNKYCLLFDMMEAVEKLREFSAAGKKIAIYGAGLEGFRFSRLVRCMNVTIDIFCDSYKSGDNIDGITIEAPEVLESLCDKCAVVIAISKPEHFLEVQKKLIDMGYPEKHLLILREHLSNFVNCRKWSDMMSSFKL